jgi:hypothetical protein
MNVKLLERKCEQFLEFWQVKYTDEDDFRSSET